MIARVGVADPGLFVLKSALRAAIVVPAAFAVGLLVIDDKQTALFAAFGSMALLVFVDFGGSPRARLRSYLALLAGGAVLIVLGTLCSQTTWLAGLAMALVAFAILFAGVLEDYIAAARAAAILTFVLPVMLPAGAAAIPDRLAGWALAGALCVPATLLLWPGRPRSAIRTGAARAARALASLADARSRGDRDGAESAAQAAHAASIAVRDRFVSMAQRPSGTAGPTAALARVIEDLGWLNHVADSVPVLGDEEVPCRPEHAQLVAAAPGALGDIAAHLDGGPSPAKLDLSRLESAHEAFGRASLAHFQRLQPDRDEHEAALELDEAYRVRELSYGVLQLGSDVQGACAAASTRSPRARAGETGRLARTHASRNSVWMRNSLRGALGLALAVLVGRLANVQDGFWVVLGTMSVLRSSAISTSATIAWALLGTLAGIVVGGLIVIVLGGEQWALWAVLPLAVLLAAYAPQAISFAAGQAGFTVVVLILFNLLQPSGWKVGIVRVEDVAIGAGVSLLVGVLMWPRGARAIVRRALGSAYLDSARYLDVTITTLLGGERPQPNDQAAREASDSAQLLDTAVRDYLSSQSAAHGRLHDLTVLSSGAARLRRIARLLEDPGALVHLAPVGETLPRLARARDAFDAQRHARVDWYAALGQAISRSSDPPLPEVDGSGERRPRRRPAAARDRDSVDAVVLGGAGADAAAVQPGLALAWAQRHLDVLAELERALSAAYARIRDGDDDGAADGDGDDGG
jgi:uncharacterized membrane protein YccC